MSVQRLESGYGDSVVLRQVSLRIEPGQVVCLMGRNGVGKTTLMKTMAGLLKARAGTIEYAGRDITGLPPYARTRLGIGYVPQGREIFGQLTVRENLLLGLEAKPGLREVPEEAVALFPVLESMYERRAGDLSGGQQQQLAFARALASRPQLLLLDEPTEGIQPSIVQDIRAAIRQVKRQGKTAILLVEQSLEFVRSVGDAFCLMEKGTVVAEGPIGELDDELVRRHLAV
ncbi:MAG TPA: urea ABC transporter ATP-binding subunit UrtE [Paenibacillaceae bacterium]